MIQAEDRVGTVLVHKYRIESLIATGGMGAIFIGTHLDLEKIVAVKIFHAHLSGNRDMVRRFFNEAKGTAKLRHRNIVDVIDVGMDEHGIPFFVMEYLDGESLKQRLAKKKILSLKESADIMIQVLMGLRVAHARGIVHRDLKPGNIFIARDPDGSEIVKILDFGVAKFRELGQEEKGDLTAEGSILGTPSFMSPEQAGGEKGDIDARADFYSCGVILYRCVAGLNPFKGDTHLQTIQNIVTMNPPPPSFVNDGLPGEVDEVVLKAISKDRDGRYQDSIPFIEALKAFYTIEESTPSESVEKIVTGEVGLESIPVDLTEQILGRKHDSSIIEGSNISQTAFPATEKSGRWKMPVMIILVLAVLGLGAWSVYVWQFRQPAGEAPFGPKASTAVPTVEPAKPEMPETPSPPAPSVKIELKGPLEGAEIFVDGSRMDGNPFTLEKSDDPVNVVVRRGDDEIFSTSIVPSQDRFLEVESPLTKPGKSSRTKKTKSGDAKKEEEAGKEEETKKSKTAPEKIFKDLDV